MKYFVIFLILIGIIGFPNSFAMPPLERVAILDDTKILDNSGNEVDLISVGNQVLIATPSFTAALPLGVHYGCGKTIVDGDEVRCTKFLPGIQHVEGDQLIGESRFEQHAVSITQIQDGHGVTVHLSWIEGILVIDHVISPTVSWIPEKSGAYSITTFFWESVNNPNALGPPMSVEVIVN